MFRSEWNTSSGGPKEPRNRLPLRADNAVHTSSAEPREAVRKLERGREMGRTEFRDLAIRLSLLTDEDLAIVIREQSRPGNIDMGKLERIAIAESMAFQLEDFLAELPVNGSKRK